MASPSLPLHLHHLTLLSLLILPILTQYSLACTTTLTPFSTCISLPTLAATLHYTFHSSNSTLSTAFTASPATSSGWVAWGINPTALSMFGTQALLAYIASNGSVIVGTYNIKSTDVVPGKISYDVSGISAKYVNGGSITIFGDWVIPNGVGTINQIWQVGPAVMADGKPVVHAMKPANLGSVGTLKLGEGSNAPAPAPGGGKSGGGGGAPPPRGGGAVVKSGGGFCVTVVVLMGVFGVFMF